MLPRFSFRSTVGRPRRWLAGAFVTALVLTLSGSVLTVPTGAAANPVTPGNYRGLGFDQCEAPSQAAMTAWRKSSPFRAAGIYISGASRACQRQANLNATWVHNQLAAGWHLMPITLGPQASCSSRYPRYGRNIDPTINASTTNTYAAARTQGVVEARRAVTAARNLGIVAGSTIFYDLEAFTASTASACTQSALRFISSWTTELHRYRYASGYYSSAASGIRMLDNARVTKGNPIVMPDQIWIADWDKKANTTSTYVRSDGWQPYRRAKQFQGGHNETWGGVRINIDRNYLDLRTPALPGVPAPAPTPTPSASTPRYTGTSLADRRCAPATISRTAYVATSSTVATSLIVPLQCLLKQQRLYPYEVTGTWNAPTTAGLNAFQRRAGTGVKSYVSQSDWVSLLVVGTSGKKLKRKMRGADVVRVQRALNAAGTPKLRVTGVFNIRTARAVGAYQRSLGMKVTKKVGAPTWARLRAGRR